MDFFGVEGISTPNNCPPSEKIVPPWKQADFRMCPERPYLCPVPPHSAHHNFSGCPRRTISSNTFVPVWERKIEFQMNTNNSDTPTAAPVEHAQLMADVVLGATNNLLEVGGGFFVKIKTNSEMLDYDELLQVIDDQNAQNLRRLKLDESDRAMIRPLLATVLAKRGAVLSPEHQLLIAVFSILIKKARMIMQIRSENRILAERIRQIIQEEASVSAQVDAELDEVLAESHIDKPLPSNRIQEEKDEVETEENLVQAEAVQSADLSQDQEEKSSEKKQIEGQILENEIEDDKADFEREMERLLEARAAELARRAEANEPLVTPSSEDSKSDPKSGAEAPAESRKETRTERRRREREERKKAKQAAPISDQQES